MIAFLRFDDSDSDSDSSSFSSISSTQSMGSSASNSSIGSTMSASSSQSSARVASSISNSSSSTEEYEIPSVFRNNRNNNNNALQEVIELNDTQPAEQAQAALPDGEDDDVVLIPDVIETIDLCTQVMVPLDLQNEIIEITDSPVPNVNRTPPRARRNTVDDGPGPSRQNRRNNRSSPYDYSKRAKTSTPIPPSAHNLDESLQVSAIKYSCPICLESVKGREPVSTMCGHVFCKRCIKASLTATSKKCPMCKKTLNSKNPFIQIYI